MLTVIVPTYNAAPYLSQAIGSLLNEKNIELEILAINDGSTDTRSPLCKISPRVTRAFE